MILNALASLYDRLYPTGKVPDFGFSEENIGFVVNIDKDGNLLGQPEDLRTKIKANTFEYKTSFVPYTNQVNVRSSSAAKVANFMVDKADYVFGMSGKDKKTVHHESFVKRIEEVCGDNDDEGIVAVRNFLKKWEPADSLNLEWWEEISGSHGKFVAFRLQGDKCFVHERPVVRELWSRYLAKDKGETGICLLDGQEHELQSQFAQFKVGSGSGASLISFNKNAYESYGKKRGENAPLSVEGEFRISTALKYLLRSR
ncbi:MAG: type I-C CRISPR-associated protein Cas8c/Csd1, partial [Lentisphaeria bacterium]